MKNAERRADDQALQIELLKFFILPSSSSFVPQCLHRVDPRGPPGRQPAGEESNGEEQQRDGCESKWIGWADSEEHLRSYGYE